MRAGGGRWVRYDDTRTWLLCSVAAKNSETKTNRAETKYHLRLASGKRRLLNQHTGEKQQQCPEYSPRGRLLQPNSRSFAVHRLRRKHDRSSKTQTLSSTPKTPPQHTLSPPPLPTAAKRKREVSPTLKTRADFEEQQPPFPTVGSNPSRT